jgi:DnaK suppressor protein
MSGMAERHDLAQFRERLEAERDQILNDSASQKDARKPVELDQQSVGRLSRMDAMQVQAMAIEAERRRSARLKKIEAALSRMEEDEFGYCNICGEAIAPKRLAHDPAAATCVGCLGD